MAGGLGLVGRSGAQNLRATVSGRNRNMKMTDASSNSMSQMTKALSDKAKMMAEQNVVTKTNPSSGSD